MIRILIALLIAFTAASIQADEPRPNAVRNPEFATEGEAFPSGWNSFQTQQSVVVDSQEKPSGASRSLRVEINSEVGSKLGEIGQTIHVKPNTQYRIAGWIKGSRSGIAFYQIKLRKGRKELERISTPKNVVQWQRVEARFDSGDADNIQLLCRWAQGEKQVGERVWFAGAELIEASGLPKEGEHEPLAIATFESLGLYWKPTEGTAGNVCHVSYKPHGSKDWRAGHDLWFDPNVHAGRPQNSQEYRGSLVHLKPGTDYDIRLRLEQTNTEKTFTARTWDESFKIKKTIILPSQWEEMLEILEGGSAEEGYVLYSPAAGETSVGDAKHRQQANVRVAASYVMIRGLNLRNAAVNGIELKDVHHVVIEDCDISGWGRISKDGFGVNGDAAVYGNSSELASIVVQRCDLHHPRSHSNSWLEERTESSGRKTHHPMGAQGIMLRKGKGRYVIRQNRIRSDMTHMFNDGMGEFANFSFAGFPNRDSDIYDNFVSHCRDDGFEIEGANMNVRVWNNCTDVCMMSLAGAATSLGPVYFWRNIALRSRYGSTSDWDGTKGGGFLKLGNESTSMTKGRMYVYHNTIYQPQSWPGRSDSSGCRSGLICTGKTKRQQNIVSRNNILHCRRDKEPAINDPFKFPNNDFDYDLILGRVSAGERSESHGIRGVPVYESATGRPVGLAPDRQAMTRVNVCRISTMNIRVMAPTSARSKRVNRSQHPRPGQSFPSCGDDRDQSM